MPTCPVYVCQHWCMCVCPCLEVPHTLSTLEYVGASSVLTTILQLPTCEQRRGWCSDVGTHCTVVVLADVPGCTHPPPLLRCWPCVSACAGLVYVMLPLRLPPLLWRTTGPTWPQCHGGLTHLSGTTGYCGAGSGLFSFSEPLPLPWTATPTNTVCAAAANSDNGANMQYTRRACCCGAGSGLFSLVSRYPYPGPQRPPTLCVPLQPSRIPHTNNTSMHNTPACSGKLHKAAAAAHILIMMEQRR
jgi:hypothetical protein